MEEMIGNPMKWHEIYQERLTTVEEAVKLIKSHDHVIIGHCICEPTGLIDAMVANHDAYRGVHITHMVSLGKGEYTDPKYKDNFTFDGIFFGAGTRNSIAHGNGDVIPVYFSELPIWMRRGILNFDVCLVMVSPPDQWGYCNLGIHSEMIADGVMDLVEAGVIDCSEKTLHKGQIVVTFLMGTKRLYDFADHNPMLMLRPVDYVNDPTVIAKNNKMVSINSALQVDFMGQVVAASIGTKQFSGVGGQVDFVRALPEQRTAKGSPSLPCPPS